MANNLFNGLVNSNWSNTGNWSQLAIPTASDGFTTRFDVTSPNCTVDTSNQVANILDFTGYTGTLIPTFSITVSGNITLGSGMTINSGLGLIMNTSGTMTSNGKTWPNSFAIQGASTTCTLAADFTIGGTFFINGSGTAKLDGAFTFICTAGYTLSQATAGSGTASIRMTGTGTFSHPGSFTLTNNITFNSAGTLTQSGTTPFGGVVTYTAGTMSMGGTGGNSSASPTFNTSGMTWNNMTFSNGTVTLTSDLNASGTFNINASGTVLNGLFNYNITGASFLCASGSTNGTSTLNFTGTTTIGNTGQVQNPVTFNTAGTITFSASFVVANKTTTYTSGTMVCTGNTLTPRSATLNTSGMTWNAVTINANQTTTLTSNLNCSGLLTLGDTNTATVINGLFNINASGSVTVSLTTGTVVGTATVVMTGTGTFSMPGATTGTLANNLTFNSAGTITISGTIMYKTGVITWTSGTMVTTSSTLMIMGSATINTDGGMTWNVIQTATLAGTLTLNSVLKASSLDLQVATTFAGTAGFSVGSFTMSVAGLTHKLVSGKTYLITGTVMSASGTTGSHIILTTTSAGMAILTLTPIPMTVQSNAFLDGTNIDSSAGTTVYTSGIITNDINWQQGQGVLSRINIM